MSCKRNCIEETEQPSIHERSCYHWPKNRRIGSEPYSPVDLSATRCLTTSRSIARNRTAAFGDDAIPFPFLLWSCAWEVDGCSALSLAPSPSPSSLDQYRPKPERYGIISSRNTQHARFIRSAMSARLGSIFRKLGEFPVFNSSGNPS